ncbi:hypothetical protein ACE38W_14950 [Chitinophaga sp. Hz27]|uniref:hypothetical protein n=1 Tax=Chitinophaga sp. Hz27 TaxID=3347169 RepID=UPI0035DDD3D0
MSKGTVKSITHERRVCSYPPIKYFMLFNAYKAANDLKPGEANNEIMKHFFDSMPASEIERIRKVAESKNSY